MYVRRRKPATGLAEERLMSSFHSKMFVQLLVTFIHRRHHYPCPDNRVQGTTGHPSSSFLLFARETFDEDHLRWLWDSFADRRGHYRLFKPFHRKICRTKKLEIPVRGWPTVCQFIFDRFGVGLPSGWKEMAVLAGEWRLNVIGGLKGCL